MTRLVTASSGGRVTHRSSAVRPVSDRRMMAETTGVEVTADMAVWTPGQPVTDQVSLDAVINAIKFTCPDKDSWAAIADKLKLKGCDFVRDLKEYNFLELVHAISDMDIKRSPRSYVRALEVQCGITLKRPTGCVAPM